MRKSRLDNYYSGITSTLLNNIKRSGLLVLVLYVTGLSIAQAKEYSILVLSSNEQDYSKTITQNIVKQLADSDIRVITSDKETVPHENIDLIVAVGSRYAKQVLENPTSRIPVLSVLIPELMIGEFINKSSRPWAAQVIDQPIERQLMLIKYLLGNQSSIGVILGPASSKKRRQIENAARNTDVTIYFNEISSADELIPALKENITQSNTLLAIPDPVVYNKNTIRGILLITYRGKIPLIGFSKSYLKAGATASLFSSPEQIAHDAARNIKNFFGNNKIFQKTILHPESFTVETNEKVARSLRLNINHEDTIKKLTRMNRAQ